MAIAQAAVACWFRSRTNHRLKHWSDDEPLQHGPTTIVLQDVLDIYFRFALAEGDSFSPIISSL
jgi:hypothetical protein